MSGKREGQWFWRGLVFLQHYIVYFFLISFVVTCCMLLFLDTMGAEAGEIVPRAEIERAAKVTFFNVVLLSFLCTVIDGIRRVFTVKRPVKRIVAAAEKIMQGDLSARVEPLRGIFRGYGDFDEVVVYFNKMAKELSGIETLRTDFIANVSHELKTPLAIMQNYAAMLCQPGLPEQRRREYAGAVMDASCRLADLISNILRLNKLENQQIFPSGQVYDLGEQLCECLLLFEEAWEKKGLKIEARIAEGVRVENDGELLSIVWNNLISNAVKFSEPGGRVFVSLKTEGDFVVVGVADEGCGIRPEVGGHIFEKFYQGDTSHAAQGNGLGLALVKRVVDIVGGEILVESEVGKGSAFTVKLRGI